jgi:hypothetical protein
VRPMAEPAKVTKLPVEPTEPDFSKPVELKYWSLGGQNRFGTLVTPMVTVGGHYEDGIINGPVKWIRKYPDGSVVIAVSQGWQAGKIASEQKETTRYVVCVGSCHGVVA